MIDGSLSLRSARYRYTVYENGSVELYDTTADPQDYVNLAGDPARAGLLREFAAALRAELAAYPVVQNRTGTPQQLLGGPGEDVLIAGFGADTLLGGAGNDTYLLRSPASEVIEQPGGGHDIVMINGVAAYTMPAEVEDLFYGRYGAAGTRQPALVTVIGNARANDIRDMEGTAFVAHGRAGNDTISSDGGAATLSGDAGDDVLSGDSGDDLLMGGDRRDRLRAGEGRDTLEGGEGDDRLAGEAGDDRLDGGGGNDLMEGGAGGDTYRVSAGADRIEETGLTGTDLLDLSRWGGLAGVTVSELRDAAGRLTAIVYARKGSTDSVTVATPGGTDPIEAIIDVGEIRLTGGDRFLGTAAAERVTGSGRADTIAGEGGADRLDGGGGDDRIAGGAGADTVLGGDGNDTLDLERMEADAAFGGPGGDLLLVAGGAGTVSGGGGLDTLRLTGAAGPLRLLEIERLELGAAGAVDAAALLAGAVAMVTGLAPGATIRVGGGAPTDLSGLSLAGLTVAGDAAANAIRLGASQVRVAAEGGNDSVLAGDGAQTLEGGEGADTLDGGDGADLLVGGAGADRLIGGRGADLYVVDALDIVIDTEGMDTIQSGGAVALAPGIEALVLTGRADVAGSGNDLGNLIVGNHGANLLSGGGGGDTIRGGAGDDTLAGGAGADLLSGGPGADVIRLAAAAEGGDELLGFDGRQDLVELSAAGFGGGLRAGMDLLADGRYVESIGNQATAAPGTGQFILETGARLLWWDADGTGAGFAAVLVLRLGDAVEWGPAEISIIA
jgi:Ca2+-binding RTX toxin-like protein